MSFMTIVFWKMALHLKLEKHLNTFSKTMFCSTMIAKEKLQVDTWHIACAMCLLFSICALLVCLQFGHILFLLPLTL